VFLDHFVERLIEFLHIQRRLPNLIYGDCPEGEYVAREVAAYFQIGEEGKSLFSPPKDLIERMNSIEHLLISDFDNTLTGDHRAIEELKEILDIHYPKLGFAIATGRQIDSTLDGLYQYDFPPPDTIISAVGAQIFYGEELYEDEGWAHYIKKNWNPQRVITLLEEFDEIDPQWLFTREGESRVSYYIDFVEDEELFVEQLKERLDAHQLSYHLIFSHSHYLDVLPYRASKGAAIDHVIGRWNLNPHQIITAGDSANDLEMFTRNLKGIVVANHEEVLASFRGQDHLFFSPSPFARGVIEGLHHFKVI
jgi:sucrose-phosphate synthase